MSSIVQRSDVPEPSPGEVSQAGTDRRASWKLAALRIIVASNVSLGLYYLSWRYLHSINWSAWFIAVPLILAETYSYVDSLLFRLTM